MNYYDKFIFLLGLYFPSIVLTFANLNNLYFQKLHTASFLKAVVLYNPNGSSVYFSSITATLPSPPHWLLRIAHF